MKPRLLFLTPVIPKADKGIRKRCLMHLTNLNQLFEVDTLIINRSTTLDVNDFIPQQNSFTPDSSVQLYVGHGKSYTQWRNSNRSQNRYIRFFWRLFCDPINSRSFDTLETRDLVEAIGDKHYDIIFSFRISMGRAAQALIQTDNRFNEVVKVVDFDDIESKTKFREAEAIRPTEGRLNALARQFEARKIAKLESNQLSFFDQIFVCSEDDKNELIAQEPQKLEKKVRVIPNALDLPVHTAASNNSNPQVQKLLFVGTMDHGPNADAIHYIIKELYPLLLEKMGNQFEIDIVGRYPTQQILEYGKLPQVNIHADVPDITEYYNSTNIVIAPIRYGGGTRLKILEAFAYSKPVISTTIGAEGIAAKDGEEIILADTATDFVARCEELISNQSLAVRIAENSHKLYLNTYTYDACLARVASHMDELGFNTHQN